MRLKKNFTNVKMERTSRKIKILFMFWMLIGVALAQNYAKHDKPKQQKRTNSPIKTIHDYSPLSILSESIKSIKQIVIPKISLGKSKPSGLTNGPRTTIAKISDGSNGV